MDFVASREGEEGAIVKEDPMEIVRRHSREAARREAERTDSEGRDLLACGYELGDLRWVLRKWTDERGIMWWRSEIVPKSMVEEE